MKQLSKREIIDVMQSDMKLWDMAETEESAPGTVVKTLNLPLGIGEYTVTIEGLKDAGKKRDALASYGAHIRGLIKERIDDEAITARAKAAAARSESVGGGDSVRDDPAGVPVPPREAPPNEEASQAYAETTTDDADFGATLIARRASLKERIGRVEVDLARWRKELKALDAACAALEEPDAPEDSPKA